MCVTAQLNIANVATMRMFSIESKYEMLHKEKEGFVVEMGGCHHVLCVKWKLNVKRKHGRKKENNRKIECKVFSAASKHWTNLHFIEQFPYFLRINVVLCKWFYVKVRGHSSVGKVKNKNICSQAIIILRATKRK